MRSTVIVGGGLVGSLLSIFLARRGWKVVVYERNGDLRRRDAVSGRSINLVLTSRGLRALDRVGLRERAMSLTVPVTGRMIHPLDDELAYQPYGKDCLLRCRFSFHFESFHKTFKRRNFRTRYTSRTNYL